MKSNLLKICLKNIPYYRSRQQEYVNKSFDQLPCINKNTVNADPKSFISDVANNQNVLATQTSGSSGIILYTYWNELEYLKSLYEIWNIRKELCIYPGDRFCTLHVGINVKGQYIRNKVIIQKNNLSLSKCYSDDETVLYYHKSLVDFQPKWMMMQPGYLYALIRSMEAKGLKLPESIKLIELTGEYCSDELLEEFRTMYPNIQWRIMYGMQEFNSIGYGIDNRLTVLKDNVYVEVVDENNNAVPADTVGDIVVTGLKNTFMPLIRYKTGDKGHWDKDGHLIIDRSRSNDSIYINDIEYDGSLFWEVILTLNASHNCAITQFQIILRNDALYIYLISSKSDLDCDKTAKTISDILIERYGFEEKVIVQLVSQIQPYTNSNKIKYFINETKRG